MNYVPKSITGALIAASIVGATTILPASAALEAVIMDKASHTLVHQATGELFTGEVEEMQISDSTVSGLAASGVAFNGETSSKMSMKNGTVMLVLDIVDPSKLLRAGLVADGSNPDDITPGLVHSGTKLPGTLNITTNDLMPKVDYTPGIVEAGPTGAVVKDGQIIINTGIGIKPTSSVWNGVSDPNAGPGSMTFTTSPHTGNLAKLIQDSSQGGKYRGLNPITARDCVAQPVENLCGVQVMLVAEDSTREKQQQFMAPFTVGIKTSYGVRMDAVEKHGPETPLTDDFGNVVSVSPSRTVGTHIPADHPFYNPANPLHPGVAAPVVEAERGLVLDPKVINHADGTLTVDFPLDAAAAGTAVVNPDGSITFTRETPAVGWDFGNQFGHVMNSDLAAGDQLSVWSGAGEHFLNVDAVDATSITVSGPDSTTLTFTGLAGGGTGANLPSVHNIPLPGYDINAKWVSVKPAAVDDVAIVQEGETVLVPMLVNDHIDKGFVATTIQLKNPATGEWVNDRVAVDGGQFTIVDGQVPFTAAPDSAGKTPTVDYRFVQTATNGMGEVVDGGAAQAKITIDIPGAPAPEVPSTPPPTPTDPPVVVPPTEEPPVVVPPTEEPPVDVPPTEAPKVPVVVEEPPVEPEVPVEEPPVVVDTPEMPIVGEEPPTEVPVEEPVIIEDEPNEKLADTGAVAGGLFAGLGALLLGAAGLFGSRLWKRKNA